MEEEQEEEAGEGESLSQSLSSTSKRLNSSLMSGVVLLMRLLVDTTEEG